MAFTLTDFTNVYWTMLDMTHNIPSYSHSHTDHISAIVHNHTICVTYGRQSYQSYMPHMADSHTNHTCHIWQTVTSIIHATCGRRSHQSYMPHMADGHTNHTCHIWQTVTSIIHATYGRRSHQSYMPYMADSHTIYGRQSHHICHIWKTVTPYMSHMADSHTNHICHIWQTVTYTCLIFDFSCMATISKYVKCNSNCVRNYCKDLKCRYGVYQFSTKAMYKCAD